MKKEKPPSEDNGIILTLNPKKIAWDRIELSTLRV